MFKNPLAGWTKFLNDAKLIDFLKRPNDICQFEFF
jgi:hypothetical protein